MFAVKQRNAYQQIQNEANVKQADKMKLLLMVYDKIITYLEQANNNIKDKEINLKNEKIDKTLTLIEVGLLGCLDLTQGEVAKNLENFYVTSMVALTNASAKNSSEEITKISQAFQSMRGAWAQIS